MKYESPAILASGVAPHLIIRCGESVVEVALEGERITIGRAPESSIRIDQGCVSYRHLELIAGPSGYEVRDLGSRNGTTLNGISMTRSRLRDRDVLRIGRGISIHFLVYSGDGEEEREGGAVRFASLHDRIEELEQERRLLSVRMRKKEAEYERLLQAIVKLKTDPVRAFAELYGQEELHYPIRFSMGPAPQPSPRRAVELSEDGLALPS